jgi:hypothetical protein
MSEYRAILIAAAGFRPTNYYQSNDKASLHRRYHRAGILNLAVLHLLAARTCR